MHTTTDLYRALLEDPGHVKQHKVVIAGVEYGEDKLISLRVPGFLFPGRGPSVGGAVSREIDLSLRGPEPIPRMAEIEVFTRLVLGSQVSEWIPKGVFYIDTRDHDPDIDVLTIHGYDAMLKAEQPFFSEGDPGSWPRSAPEVVAEICRRIGFDLDSRTVLNASYMVPFPNDYTMREILRHVAAAHVGNWIITDAGELRLVRLNELPPETNYLVTEHGYAITFGGVRILV